MSKTSWLRTTTGVLAVCGAFSLGWFLSNPTTKPPPIAPTAKEDKDPPFEEETERNTILVLTNQAQRVLYDWSPVSKPDPVKDIRPVSKAKGLQDVRSQLEQWSGPPNQRLRKAIEPLESEALGLGFPPLLTPLVRAPIEPGDPIAPPARFVSTLASIGVRFPQDQRVPHEVHGASLVLSRTASAFSKAEVQLLRNPQSVLGDQSSLWTLTNLGRSEHTDGWWFLRHSLPSSQARSGLHEAYLDVIRLSLLSVRALVETLKVCDAQTLPLVSLWAAYEIRQLRTPLGMALIYIPPEDLLRGLPDGPAALVHTVVYALTGRMQTILGPDPGPLYEKAILGASQVRQAEGAGVLPFVRGYGALLEAVAASQGRKIDVLRKLLPWLHKNQDSLAPAWAAEAGALIVVGIYRAQQPISSEEQSMIWTLLAKSPTESPPSWVRDALRILKFLDGTSKEAPPQNFR